MDAFFRLTRSKFKFKLYLLTNLPAAFFAGLRVTKADTNSCIIMVPYRWSTRNPFRSIYFACLAMAAEMSTGILAMANTYKSDPRVSMLVVNMEAGFTKKATGRTRFTCEDGKSIREAVERAKATGEAQMIKTRSVGTLDTGEIVAEFFISWSFKAKSKG
ncbi:MAG TPA: DUF4442 domain-containing protein [Puia sp.]|nr:DUF4442 domain-containing protein [Puia sp.]